MPSRPRRKWQALSSFGSSQSGNHNSTDDEARPCEVDDRIMSYLHEFQGDQTHFEKFLQYVEAVPHPSLLACCVLDLLPDLPDKFITKKTRKYNKRLAAWLGKSAQCISNFRSEIPDVLRAYRRVFKLDKAAMPISIPPAMFISAEALSPLKCEADDIDLIASPSSGEMPPLEQMFRLDDEQRRCILLDRDFPNRAIKLFNSSGALVVDDCCRELELRGILHARIKPQTPSRTLPVRRAGAPAFVHSMAAFESNLACFSQNLLRGLDLGPDRLVLGGSSTMTCAMPLLPACIVNHVRRKLGPTLSAYVLDFVYEEPPWLDAEEGCFAGSDLDLFIIANSSSEAKERFASAAEQLYKNMCGSSRFLDGGGSGRRRQSLEECSKEHVVMVRTGNTLTFCGLYPLRHVQLVAHYARSVEELLAFVDLDCTAMVYDGSDVWAAPRALRAHTTGYNVVSPAWLRYVDPAGCTHVPCRVLKYAKRGFGCLLCQCGCQHTPRCDVTLHGDNSKMMAAISTLQNTPDQVSKLVKEALEFQRYSPNNSSSCNLLTAKDYYGSLSLFPGIPRGPRYPPAILTRMLHQQTQQYHNFATSAVVSQGHALAIAIPQPINSLDELRSQIDEIVCSRIEKSLASVIEPRNCL